MKRRLTLLAALLLRLLALPGQLMADAYTDYIDRYASMAIAEEQRSGVPASITLAQGLLESAAGRSTLAREGNNHFGIKCGGAWQGETMLRDDDAPDECFRVYDSAADSFADHSDFLRRRRYQSLFDLDPDDYAAWAHGLSACGYATDPKYADRLIAIIERYALYAYSQGNGANSAQVADFIVAHLQGQHRIQRFRGLHMVIANPGDTYDSIAREFNLDPDTLAAYNDADSPSQPIKDWEEVYLQEKYATAPDNVRSATIGTDECMHSVAQRYAIKMADLMSLNPGARDEPGTRLKLRK